MIRQPMVDYNLKKRVFFIRVRNVGLAKDNQRSLLTKSYTTTCCRVSFRCKELDTFHTRSTHLLLVLRDSGLHVVHDSANNQVCGYCQVMYLSFALRLLTTLLSFGHWIISPLPYGFWPLWYLHTFGHWIICPLLYGFWLPLWYLLVIELSVLCLTVSD
jgi:hypothetical protein